MTRTRVCVWCGSVIADDQEDRRTLCPECSQVDEMESATPMHPIGERQPFQD